MNPRNWSINQFATAGMLIFVLGIATAGASWKTNVERTQVQQSDSIYVNAVKYEALQQFCVQLQAVNRTQTERLESLESHSKTSEQILRDLYRHETGQDWNE